MLKKSRRCKLRLKVLYVCCICVSHTNVSQGLEGESLALLGRSFVKEGKLTSLEADNKVHICSFLLHLTNNFPLSGWVLLFVFRLAACNKEKIRYKIQVAASHWLTRGTGSFFRVIYYFYCLSTFLFFVQVVSVPDDKGNKNMFRIVCGTEITMIADTPEEKSEWITIMKEVINYIYAYLP